MGMGHFHRLLRIVTLLQTRQHYNVPALAQELGVSQRTVHRDLNALELAKVPYHYDPETKGYSISGDFFLPPVQLTLSEAMALSVLASQLARQKQIPFVENAWQAVLKIESPLPIAIRQELSASSENLFIQCARTCPQDGAAGHYDILNRAIAQKRKVRCIYEGGSDAESGEEFFFRPYALFFGQRAWYVVGYSERRRDERCLKLNRLKQCGPTDRPYMIPDGWDLETHLGKAWRMIRGDTRYRVVIHFDNTFARTMAETLWHPTQKIIWRADGSCLFECEVDGLSEIVWWVLGYGPHAQVLEPPALRDQVKELAQAMCARYGNRSPSQRAGGVAHPHPPAAV